MEKDTSLMETRDSKERRKGGDFRMRQGEAQDDNCQKAWGATSSDLSRVAEGSKIDIFKKKKGNQQISQSVLLYLEGFNVYTMYMSL